MLKLMKKTNKVKYIDVCYIYKSANQPRKIFDDDEIASLSRSIQENGLIQPVTVRKISKEHYDIIAGERRVRASIMAGMKTIPCIVMECSNEKMAVLSLLENIQREDLDPFEEANAIRQVMQKNQLTQEEIAKKLGKSQSAIANKLRLLRLDEDEVEKIRDAKLTERHARALIRIKDKFERDRVIDKIIENNLNVSQTDELISTIIDEQPAITKLKGTKKVIVKDIRIFLNTVSKAIKLMRVSGIDASSVKNETDEYIEYVVKIPKTKNTA